MSIPASAYGSAETYDPIVDKEIRCRGVRQWDDEWGHHKKVCDKLLIEFAARPWQVRCTRCKTLNHSAKSIESRTL